MVDNDQSKIRYDDFIGNVQPDPAKPESTIMLSGFVGRGPEGHARVYPDPTLGSWYDIPEGDILHSTPIADSKLGGSYIWVRASSEIKPGSAAPAASEAEAVQPQQAAGVGFDPTPRTFCFVCDLPKAAVAMQPTPATHCYICPPATWGPCRTALCDIKQMPTPEPRLISFSPGLCPGPYTMHCSWFCTPTLMAAAAPAAMALPHTAATVCTQFGCPPQPDAARLITPGTIGPTGTFGCTIWQCPTLGSNWWECHTQAGLCTVQVCVQAAPRAAAAPAAMAMPDTVTAVCQQLQPIWPVPVGPPTMICPFPQTPQTPQGPFWPMAHVAAGALPQTKFLCTQGLATFCGCTPGIDCNAAPGNVQTQAPICTQGFPTFCGCTPGIDCMGLAARAPQQANATAVTVCVTDCQPPVNQMMRAPIGNPTDPTPQSACFVCDQQMAAAMQPTPTVQTHCFICPPHTQAVHCWTAPVVCDTMQTPTPATRCFICPQPHQTLATICTQVGCPTHQIHCPTQPVVCNLMPTQPVVCGVLPPSFGCPQGGAQPQHGMAMAAPAHPNTAATLCTQHPACPPNTVNTPCVTFVCPTVGACPTVAACTPNGVFTPFGR